jgi:ribosomal protein L14E/L6E/L27E
VFFKVGQIVQSAAGRDKGLFMVILALEGDYALIADGKERKIKKPKKKKLKHLFPTNTETPPGELLTNRSLRRILLSFNQN